MYITVSTLGIHASPTPLSPCVESSSGFLAFLLPELLPVSLSPSLSRSLCLALSSLWPPAPTTSSVHGTLRPAREHVMVIASSQARKQPASFMPPPPSSSPNHFAGFPTRVSNTLIDCTAVQSTTPKTQRLASSCRFTHTHLPRWIIMHDFCK